MESQIETLLPMADCLRPRTPKEFREWVLAKCNAFSQVAELRAPVLLHQGLFKWFHEELYPLSVFVVAKYGERDDVFCAPKRDQGYDVDAEIREPTRTIKVEITSAREPNHHLRMEYLVRHRRVSLTGPVMVEGNKTTGREIHNEVEFVDHRESLGSHLNWIRTAAEGKAGYGRYGRSYELLISVDDWWFDPDDSEEVVAFIHREILSLPLQFESVHIVGVTGRLYFSFPLETL